MLETCSSRSQKTHPYFVEDNLKQNISIVGIELFQLKLGKNIHTHDLKRLELPRRELTQLDFISLLKQLALRKNHGMKGTAITLNL